MISKATIKKIKDNIPIETVISQYTDINSQNKANCNIHGESEPSLQVYPETNSWFCFGCNQGGDLIKYIELSEGMDFIEAVKKIADNERIDIEYNSIETFSISDLMRLISDLKDVENEQVFDESILERYNRQHKYLLELGYQPETLKEFEVGYCYEQNDELFDRITIPWRDYDGNLIAVMGRDVSDDKKVKYIAKRGSSKKKHLFNLHKAKEYADKGLIVCECEKSVMRLYEFGFKNAIALGNSDLGDRKWLLRRFTEKVYLCLDNKEIDKAGERAFKKICKQLKPLLQVFHIPLPIPFKDAAEIKEKELWLKCWKNKKVVV